MMFPVRPPTRRRGARTAGAGRLVANACLIASLLALVAVAPVRAGHAEFPGHTHPEGTPDHHHTLSQVGLLSVAAATPTLDATVREIPAAEPLEAPEAHPRQFADGGTRARAPPAAPL